MYYNVLLHSCQNEKCFSKKALEKIKTHILCSVTFFSENFAVCEIMWKNVIEPGRPQMAIQHMQCTCWMSVATDTH